MIDSLLLLSGNDIPFIEMATTIHVPKIKEIAFIGEENFFSASSLLNFSIDILPEEDKKNLQDQTNFDILIAMMKQRDPVIQKNKNCLIMFLSLFFPTCTIQLDNNIILQDENIKETYIIDNNNFEIFKNIINQILVVEQDSSLKYNPKGAAAAKIADQLKNRHKKLAEEKKHEKIDIISRYISILAVAEQKSINSFMDYTIYQLFDEFKRFQLKMNHDYVLQARLAGAKDIKDAEDWMSNIHSDDKSIKEEN